jgi:hypothetical protein
VHPALSTRPGNPAEPRPELGGQAAPSGGFGHVELPVEQCAAARVELAQRNFLGCGEPAVERR